MTLHLDSPTAEYLKVTLARDRICGNQISLMLSGRSSATAWSEEHGTKMQWKISILCEEKSHDLIYICSTKVPLLAKVDALLESSFGSRTGERLHIDSSR